MCDMNITNSFQQNHENMVNLAFFIKFFFISSMTVTLNSYCLHLNSIIFIGSSLNSK
jgi:hypothetical protein